MNPARIVTLLFALGFTVFLLKFFLAPAPVEESRSIPIGRIGDFTEGVTPLSETRVFVVRSSREIYLLASIDRNTGCRLEWTPIERHFRDTCSASRYDLSGDPLP